MTTRILLAVDDSPGGLVAAHVAIDLAARLGARLRAVNVLRDGVLTEILEAMTGSPGMGERRGEAATAVLRQVAALARRSGVDVETSQLEGSPAVRILAEARAWPSDLTVIARSQQRQRAGEPYIGSETAHVLEFTEQPVLVVPHQ
jgi:nucleotide-binding universal stress UspA family protein